MAKQRTGIMPSEPGLLVWYTLDELTRRRRKRPIDPDAWGLCECDNVFWLGEKTEIEGKEALRIPLSEILERRNIMHPEWGDEEVYLFVGISDEEKDESGNGKFAWYLLNEDEANEQFALTEQQELRTH